MSKENYNRTLVDEEIVKWAKDTNWDKTGGIYQNFEENNVQGETYDIRAGNLIVVGEADGTRTYVSLKDQKEVTIEPFRSATVQSLEKIKLPADMYGELWITNALQHQGLAFTGGDIDPGYWGYLYIKIHNVGPVPVSIRYQKDIASIRFVRMHRPAIKHYTKSEILNPRDEQLPPCSPRTLYDWLQLSAKLDGLTSSVKRIDWVQDRFVTGIFVGIVSGGVLAAFLAVLKILGIVL